jgi:hypothetical protein
MTSETTYSSENATAANPIRAAGGAVGGWAIAIT